MPSRTVINVKGDGVLQLISRTHLTSKQYTLSFTTSKRLRLTNAQPISRSVPSPISTSTIPLLRSPPVSAQTRQISSTPRMKMPPPARSRDPSPNPATLSLPRILCLHGGGVNASVFRNQLRSFLSHPSLVNRFRFVFTDAPFFCDEGIGVYPVYADWGPFRRWFRWLPTHEEVSVETAHHELGYVLRRAMEGDEGTGEWVGVLGFSQGAKLACSMLYEQQLCQLSGGSKTSPWKFRFGVIMAGRCPFAAISEESEEFPWMQSAGGLPDAADIDSLVERPDMRLQIPTVHVHGLKDEGLHLHKRCVEEYCAPGTTTVVEWDGPHRVAVRKADVDRIVGAMVEVADEYGA